MVMMLVRMLAGLVVAVAMMAGGAVAGPYEDGVAVANRGDYARALELWTPLAEQGVARALNNLGSM